MGNATIRGDRREAGRAEPRPGTTMDLRELALFARVAEAGSFTRAARELGLSQSAASQRVAALERRLGTRLVVRHPPRGAAAGGRLPLTPAGELLLGYTRQLLRTLEAARTALAGLGDGADPAAVVGRLRLAVEDGATQRLLVPVLLALRERHPRVVVSVSVEPTDAALERLREGELDLALVVKPDAAAGVELEPLGRDELVAVAPPGYPWGERTVVEPAALREAPLLVPDRRSQSFRLFERWLLEAGAAPGSAPHLAADASDAAILCALARAGLGVGIVPSWAARGEEVPRLRALPLGPARVTRTWMLARPARHPEPAISRVVRQLCRERFRLAPGPGCGPGAP